MDVVFDNYIPNQIVQTPIIVLKGIIVTKDPDKLNVDCFEAILNTNCVTFSDLHTLLPVKFVQDKFVLVARLEPGDNDLIFRYDQVEIGRIRLTLQNHMANYKYYVQGLIVYCSDSDHDESRITTMQNKIALGIKLAQTIFSEVLYGHTQRRLTFQLRHEGSCEVMKLGLTRSELASEYGTQELWEYLARQIKEQATLWSTKCKYVAFVLDPWRGVGKDVDMQALGGGGLAVLDSQCLEVWPDRKSVV